MARVIATFECESGYPGDKLEIHETREVGQTQTKLMFKTYEIVDCDKPNILLFNMSIEDEGKLLRLLLDRSNERAKRPLAPDENIGSCPAYVEIEPSKMQHSEITERQLRGLDK